MNLLEKWLRNLINKPVESLDDEYTDELVTRKELNILFLPLMNPYKIEQEEAEEASHVSSAILQQFHDKVRDCPCEEAIWSGLFLYFTDPLPLSIAHDLIDRGIATITMGMTRQVDEIQWRLATFDDEALYTLVRERYMEPQYTATQFKTMLELYAFYREGVLDMLSFYETQSFEKKAVFMAAVAHEQERLNELADVRTEVDEQKL